MGEEHEIRVEEHAQETEEKNQKKVMDKLKVSLWEYLIKAIFLGLGAALAWNTKLHNDTKNELTSLSNRLSTVENIQNVAKTLLENSVTKKEDEAKIWKEISGVKAEETRHETEWEMRKREWEKYEKDIDDLLRQCADRL